jgi:LysM repeat protein
MLAKRTFHLTILFVFLVLLLATPKPALAWSGCGSSYYVHRGDTLWSIANNYGTTVAAIRQANPSLGYVLYAGQTLCIPDGYQSGGYDYQSGGPDYQGNGMGYQGNGMGYQGNGMGYQGNGMGYQGNGMGYQGNGMGYQGNGMGYQGNGMGYQSNGHAGYQAPGWGGGTYVVQWGDTLKLIAARNGTTLGNLLALNPQIWNPNWIYAGQVIRLW